MLKLPLKSVRAPPTRPLTASLMTTLTFISLCQRLFWSK
jgi:hypothetical protein